MKTKSFRSHLCLAVLALFFCPPLTYAMSGMDLPHGGHGNATSSLTETIGDPINSSEERWGLAET